MREVKVVLQFRCSHQSSRCPPLPSFWLAGWLGPDVDLPAHALCCCSRNGNRSLFPPCWGATLSVAAAVSVYALAPWPGVQQLIAC